LAFLKNPIVNLRNRDIDGELVSRTKRQVFRESKDRVHSVKDLLKRNHVMVNLDLGFNQLRGDALLELANTLGERDLKANNLVKHVDLRNNELNQKSMLHFGSFLKNAPRLQYISLRCNPLHNIGMASVSIALINGMLKNLHILDLTRVCMNYVGLELLCKGLTSGRHQIHQLNLAGNFVFVDFPLKSAKLIASLVEQLVHLESLILSRMGMLVEPAWIILKSLKNSSLKDLILYDNRIRPRQSHIDILKKGLLTKINSQ